jgi:hypothetical protein
MLKAPVPEVGAFSSIESGKNHLVNLGGTVDKPGLAGIAIDPLQGRVL